MGRSEVGAGWGFVRRGGVGQGRVESKLSLGNSVIHNAKTFIFHVASLNKSKLLPLL